MPYFNRQKSVTWTSPSGEVFELPYVKDYEYSGKHIGEVKENAIKQPKGSKIRRKIIGRGNDTFQDLGVSGRDIPLQVTFTGEDHDIQAQNFENAICEVGKSRLQLQYGSEITVNVIRFKRKGSTVNDVASTIFEVEFHETGATTYPRSVESEKSQIKQEAQELDTENATALSILLETASPVEVETIADTFEKNLDIVNSYLPGGELFDAIMADVKSQPLATNTFTIGMQTARMLKAGLATYSNAKNLISSVTGMLGILMGTFLSRETLLTNDFFAKSILIAASQTVINNELNTRKESVQTAQELQESHQKYKEYIDDEQAKFASFEDAFVEEVDVNSIVQNAAGFLIEQSYNLKIEKTIMLDEVSNLIEIGFKYFAEDFAKDPDKVLDDIAKTNDFADDDFLILEKGREVLIYV